MSDFDSIFINGKSLRPAPFVSTSYEYNMSGSYVIGGFLLVNLSGTIVSEDIANQMNSLSSLQMNSDCVSIKIGCSGGSDFLDGSGRIRSMNISPGDHPYMATYSMQIAVESINGNPVVEPDEEFLKRTCLSANDAKFLLNYDESLSISGEGNTITSVDNVLKVSKSYIKASGRITMVSFSKSVCGVPEYNGIENSIGILQRRAKSLMSMTTCGADDSPLSQFSGWNRWLDTKTLTINGDGSADWTFDMYLSKGSAKPFAWIDITTSDKSDQKNKTENRSISGNIQGLSSANIDDYLGDRVDVNERINNARTAYAALNSVITNGSWPTDGVILVGQDCNPTPTPTTAPCGNSLPKYCKQRISSTIKESPVSGEISFSAEFGSINACNPNGVGSVDFTIDEQLSADRHYEYIIPGYGDSVVVDLKAPTPHKVTITAKGQITNCDKTKIPELIRCVTELFLEQLGQIQGSWVLVNKSQTIGRYSYSITHEYVECDA